MLTKNHIKKLWGVFTMAYGQNWTCRGLTDENDVWFLGLNDLTPNEFECGLSKIALNESPFPPSLGQFRSWCKPKIQSISVSEKAHIAWQIVMENPEEPNDPVTKKVMRAFGGWATFCRSLTYDNMQWHEKRFIEHYESLCDAHALYALEGDRPHELP